MPKGIYIRKPNSMVGKYIRTEHHKVLLRKARPSICGNNNVSKRPEVRLKISQALKGRKFSEKHCNKISLSKRLSGCCKGKNNPNYTDGKTPLLQRLKNTYEYRLWVSDVFARDKFTCQICGEHISGNLNAHHIVAFSTLIRFYEINSLEKAIKSEVLWNINNGLTVCKECHKKLHTFKYDTVYNKILIGIKIDSPMNNFNIIEQTDNSIIVQPKGGIMGFARRFK